MQLVCQNIKRLHYSKINSYKKKKPKNWLVRAALLAIIDRFFGVVQIVIGMPFFVIYYAANDIFTNICTYYYSIFNPFVT